MRSIRVPTARRRPSHGKLGIPACRGSNSERPLDTACQRSADCIVWFPKSCYFHRLTVNHNVRLPMFPPAGKAGTPHAFNFWSASRPSLPHRHTVVTNHGVGQHRSRQVGGLLGVRHRAQEVEAVGREHARRASLAAGAEIRELAARSLDHDLPHRGRGDRDAIAGPRTPVTATSLLRSLALGGYSFQDQIH